MVTVGLARIYISYRQLLKYKLRSMDLYISQFFDQKEFEDSQSYNEEKAQFNLIEALFTLIFDFLIWFFFVPAWVWNSMDTVMAKFNWC